MSANACRGKKRYRTPVDAMLALSRIQRERRIDEVDKYERTYYPCFGCGQYHLTSWNTEEG